MASSRELDTMRRAIVLSAFGLGTTSPNPPVGCVILDPEGGIVGEGYHERKGEPHAETHALAAAGGRARGGSAVVTLEPCDHHGRTPPCRQALIDAGVARVIISVIDPTSRGEGGAFALQGAGLDIEVGVLEDRISGSFMMPSCSMMAGSKKALWTGTEAVRSLCRPLARRRTRASCLRHLLKVVCGRCSLMETAHPSAHFWKLVGLIK